MKSVKEGGANETNDALSKGSNRSFAHSSAFIWSSPSLKLGANTLPAAHVQPAYSIRN